MNHILRCNILPAILIAAMVGLIRCQPLFCETIPKGDKAIMQADANSSSRKTAEMLASHKVWIIPQPKSVEFGKGSFDLSSCAGIASSGSMVVGDEYLKSASAVLRDKTGISIDVSATVPTDRSIILGIFPNGRIADTMPRISDADLQGLGDQGYVIHIDKRQVSIAALDKAGLFYGIRTLGQIAAGRTSLPAMRLRDWPSVRYRGVQYDVSRGQMPTISCLKGLADILACESKGNVLELYIEDTFKWKSYPDISPAEGITPLEGRQLFDYASRRMMEVRPMMQVLGHFGKIGDKAPYQKFMVRVPSGNTTVDVRKPEAVAFVSNLVDEICSAFPGKFLNVDVTEIDDEGYKLTGTGPEELPDLLMQYMVKLNEVTKRHGTRLMVAQCQLRAQGHLNGIGSRINDMPRDIAVSSYYTAEFYGGWDYDFPLMHGKGIDFFANPWIDSHSRIMPYVGHAMDFSDITVNRGLQYGVLGSVSADWGDAGHYQLPGVTIYPFMYHCASAWTGAALDRDYFNESFSRIVFGAKDDSISRAIALVGNINGRPLKIRNAAGEVETPPYTGNSTLGWYFNEFFDDPFTDARIKQIADPEQMGKDILNAADESVRLLKSAKRKSTLHLDVIDELLFAARNYQAMGRKLIVLCRYNDPAVPRSEVAHELSDLADTYEELKSDFRKLWLSDCKDAGTFAYLTGRFDQTIIPCRKMSEELILGK